MRRSTSQRKPNALVKKRQSTQRQQQQQQPEESILPIVEPVVNPASQAKLDLLAEKEAELNQVLKIKEKSDALVKCFNDLAEGITNVSKGAQGVSNTLRNWDNVFSIMGEMNHHKEESNPHWVRFEKSIISDNNKELITDNPSSVKRKLRE